MTTRDKILLEERVRQILMDNTGVSTTTLDMYSEELSKLLQQLEYKLNTFMDDIQK